MSSPDVVVGIFQENDRILLQYRINTPRSPEHWGLPAGRVEPGETGETAIHREMMEELGVSFTPKPEPEFSWAGEGGKRFDAFIVERYTGTISNREPTYCGQLAWFRLQDLPEPLTPATAEILKILGSGGRPDNETSLPNLSMEIDLLLKKKPGGLSALVAKDFALFQMGSSCGDLSFRSWKHEEISIGPDRYVVRADGRSNWVLELRRSVIARCERYAARPKLEFAIQFDDRVWRVKSDRKKLVLGYDIWEEEARVGRVTPRIGLWSWSKIEAKFNQMPPLEIAGFAIWLIGIHWVGTAGNITAARVETGL